MPAGTSTLAVGKPSSVPPRASPWTTTPRTWWGRPSSSAASVDPPSATRPRIRVEEMGPDARRPRRRTAARCPSTSKPAGGPHLGEQGHVALPPVAEVEVLAHHHQPGAEAPTRTSPTNVLGRLVRPLLVEARGPRCAPPRPPPAARASGRGRTGATGRRFGADHRGRMAVEGHHHGGRARRPGPPAGARPAGPGGRGGRRRRPRWSPPTPGTAGCSSTRSVTMSITGGGYRPPAGTSRRPAGRSGLGVPRLIRPPPGRPRGGSGRCRWPRRPPAGGGGRRPDPTDRRR